jgi:hypothetical protein
VAGKASQGFTLSMFESINITKGHVDPIVITGNRLYSDDQLNEFFGLLQGEAIFLDNVENAFLLLTPPQA